jgi:hypothetical protein
MRRPRRPETPHRCKSTLLERSAVLGNRWPVPADVNGVAWRTPRYTLDLLYQVRLGDWLAHQLRVRIGLPIPDRLVGRGRELSVTIAQKLRARCRSA